MKKTGIVVIIIGIIMTVFTGFEVITEKEVVDLGAVEVNQKKKTPIYWSPVTGLIIAGLGTILVIVGKRGVSNS